MESGQFEGFLSRIIISLSDVFVRINARAQNLLYLLLEISLWLMLWLMLLHKMFLQITRLHKEKEHGEVEFIVSFTR